MTDRFKESLDRYLTRESPEGTNDKKNWRITKTIIFVLEGMTEDEAVDSAADTLSNANNFNMDDFEMEEI